MTDVVTEADLDEAPEKVWRALTEPQLLAAWLSPNDAKAEAGARFTFEAMAETQGPVECEVLEADPPRDLRLRWRTGEVDSEVAFTLAPNGLGGTRLTIVHSGLPALPVPANDAHETVMRLAA